MINTEIEKRKRREGKKEGEEELFADGIESEKEKRSKRNRKDARYTDTGK